MARFQDVYMSSRIVGYPVQVGPLFSTQLVAVDSGAESANRRWLHPLRSINLPEGVRDHATFEDLKKHWLIMGGPAHTFPFRDPTDFASVDLSEINVTPSIAFDDVEIGVGDGVTTDFQLIKKYTVGAFTYTRNIEFPIVSSCVFGISEPGSPAHIVPVGGSSPFQSPPTTVTVTRPGGIATFTPAPAAGTVLTAGFLFDIQVRYESDDTFNGIMRTFGVSGFADIPLQEVRYCND